MHLGQGDRRIPFLTFGAIFDLPRLRETIRHPVLDWRDVKRAKYDDSWGRNTPLLEGVAKETLGCWSVKQGFKRDLELLLGLGESNIAI